MSNTKRFHILIKGIVQGVGFRPFVYNLAHSLDVKGYVLNSSEGVHIEIEATDSLAQEFVNKIKTGHPPRAVIKEIKVEELEPAGFKKFIIKKSKRKEGEFVLISPDIATCKDCLNELFDTEDRRYRYPFINCTNCGPRFTIIEDIPYDRPKTTMKKFKMCARCQSEYDNPLNRRFHAQPNACPVCGPHLMLVAKKDIFKKIEKNYSGSLSSLNKSTLKDFEIPPSKDLFFTEKKDALKAAEKLITNGGILALKGLGGFHLACDATNEKAVRKLRKRKRRPTKPFAVMAKSINQLKELVHLNQKEIELLKSPTAPILLAEKKIPEKLAFSVAPYLKEYGVMLPSTPLHHLLLRDVNIPLVMTSANLTEEPIVKDNLESFRRLGKIADAFLIHNRGIYSRYDDSVLKFVNNELTFLRRARSYAPYPLDFPYINAPSIFAAGPELKSTFSLTREKFAFISQHLGDLEDEVSFENYSRTVELYKRLFRIKPEIIACDLHPDYLSTEYAEKIAGDRLLYKVQHHHAHIASILGEHEIEGPVIGFAFDGTGFGPDRTIWGGEVLIATTSSFERFAHIRKFPLIGGESAIKKPYRTAVSVILDSRESLKGLKFLKNIPENEISLLSTLFDKKTHCPITSSLGRIFDAAAAIVGVGTKATYEGELAIRFEALAKTIEEGYHFKIKEENPYRIDFRPVFKELIKDVKRGLTPDIVSGKFHRGVSRMVIDISKLARKNTGLNTVAFSGGVWQNSLLIKLTKPQLEKNNFKVLTHRQLPPNDGCISHGQAIVAAKRHLEKS